MAGIRGRQKRAIINQIVNICEIEMDPALEALRPVFRQPDIGDYKGVSPAASGTRKNGCFCLILHNN